MSTFMAFILGLLVGWIIEWIIDWIYWRRRSAESTPQEAALQERLKAAEARSEELEHQLSIQKARLESQVKAPAAPISSTEVLPVEPPVVEAAPVRSVAMPVVHDDLEIIKGIGPVIARKLNAAGIYSFADLAALTPERLRELVGDVISRLADEETIIEQAKQLAAKEQQGG